MLEMVKKVFYLFLFLSVFSLLYLVVSGASAKQYRPVRDSIWKFSDLHVDGNLLKNKQGESVILRGVNRSGGEYMCVQGRGIMDGPVDDSTIKAMKSWGINVVRLPLNEHCWLGLSDVVKEFGGKNYRQFVKDYVRRLNDHQIYVILDLHWSGPELGDTSNQPMPNSKYSAKFWDGVARAFKGNRRVLFDVFNEPHADNNQDSDLAWECWRDGGFCEGVTYETVGAQELVDVIRDAGAKNVLLVGGVRYSNILSKWELYKPRDALNNIVASWHVYPNGNPCNTISCYDSMMASVAAKFSLIAGEVGESVNGDVCGVEKTNEVLDWLEGHGAGYLAWTWNKWSGDCGNWSLITNFDGTAKFPNGTNYRERLLNVVD